MLPSTVGIPLAIEPVCDRYLSERLVASEEQLTLVRQRGKDNDLPDATFSDAGLKLMLQESNVVEQAQQSTTGA